MGKRLLAVIFAYGLFSSAVYYHLLVSDEHKSYVGKHKSDLLLLTAHPDDETMFFGPFLIKHLQATSELYQTNPHDNAHVHVLCITSGEADGNGAQRAEELVNATHSLGINRNNVHVWNDARWADGQQWDIQELRNEIQTFIQTHKSIQEVVTFDEHGVSGHLNHRSLFTTVQGLRSRLPRIRFYALKSVNLVQKYCAFLDVWWAYWMSKTNQARVYVLGFNEYLKLISSLYEHRSQMVWFRQLYSIFSKYMYFNVLEPL